ncbi:hypothetical protein BLOT_005018 [Blomia tropicalis]|nr:hypothetical protein BLOT_005018 [Blomia tropicalis]
MLHLVPPSNVVGHMNYRSVLAENARLLSQCSSTTMVGNGKTKTTVTLSSKKKMTMKRNRSNYKNNCHLEQFSEVIVYEEQSQTVSNVMFPNDEELQLFKSEKQFQQANQLLNYSFMPWTSVSELIKVHNDIYSSIRFQWNEYQLRKKVIIKSDPTEADSSKNTSEKYISSLKWARDMMTQWKTPFLKVDQCRLVDVDDRFFNVMGVRFYERTLAQYVPAVLAAPFRKPLQNVSNNKRSLRQPRKKDRFHPYVTLIITQTFTVNRRD